MTEAKDIIYEDTWEDAVEAEIGPATSVNDMLRTMAFTSQQTGGSFLVRHGDQDSGVWVFHLGIEEEGFVHITQRVLLPMRMWLDANSWTFAWPTVGEQFERLQREADEELYRAHRAQDRNGELTDVAALIAAGVTLTDYDEEFDAASWDRWLRAALASGPMKSEQLMAAAEQAGICWGGFIKGIMCAYTDDGQSWWYLPGHGDRVPELTVPNPLGAAGCFKAEKDPG